MVLFSRIDKKLKKKHFILNINYISQIILSNIIYELSGRVRDCKFLCCKFKSYISKCNRYTDTFNTS